MYNQENTAMKFVVLTINTENELEGVEAGVKNSQEVRAMIQGQELYGKILCELQSPYKCYLLLLVRLILLVVKAPWIKSKMSCIRQISCHNGACHNETPLCYK